MSGILLLFPIIFPFVCAVIGARTKFKKKLFRNIYIISSLVINIIILCYIVYINKINTFHLIRYNEFIDIYFKIDKLGSFFTILVSILWIFTAFYSFDYMQHEGQENRFYTFFLCTLGITIGIGFSGNLLTLYFFYELLTLSTFPLVIHSGGEEARYSGKKYLIYSFGGATLALLGIILLSMYSGNIDFACKGIIKMSTIDQKNLLLTIYLLLFLGFGVKAALVPFHSWLPAAMVAPTPVSALLHAVAVVKSGIFAIIRVSYYIFGVEIIKQIDGNIYTSILISITILLGSLLAIYQTNLKKRLAYSTISQLGYILLGITMLNKDALIGGIFHLINHAFIKITLFFCVGAIYYKTGKKTIHEIKGIGKKMPITMWCFGIASISLVGIPPTNGFVSKWYLALGGLKANVGLFAVILLVSAFLTAGYLLPVVITAFFQGKHVKNENKNEPPLRMLLSIIVLTGVVIILGLFPNPVLLIIKDIVNDLI